MVICLLNMLKENCNFIFFKARFQIQDIIIFATFWFKIEKLKVMLK